MTVVVVVGDQQHRGGFRVPDDSDSDDEAAAEAPLPVQHSPAKQATDSSPGTAVDVGSLAVSLQRQLQLERRERLQRLREAEAAIRRRLSSEWQMQVAQYRQREAAFADELSKSEADGARRMAEAAQRLEQTFRKQDESVAQLREAQALADAQAKLAAQQAEEERLRKLRQSESEAHAERLRQQALEAEQRRRELEQKQLEAQKQAEQERQRAQDAQQRQAVEQLEQQVAATYGSAKAIEAQQYYADLLASMQKRIQPILQSTDPHMKQQRMDLKKETNKRVGQIAASREKVLDVASQLTELLRRHHSAGMRDFVLDVAASKFVEQAQLNLRGRSQYLSFYMASVVALVTQRVPEFWDVLLAHMMQECPYVVPVFRRKRADESADEFKKILVQEADEKHIESVGAVVAFYATLVSLPVRRNHFHGIEHGWTWLARFLNLKPRVLTPDVLYFFLKFAGNTMAQAYGRQFRKLVAYMQQHTLKNLPEGAGPGGVSRLDMLLNALVSHQGLTAAAVEDQPEEFERGRSVAAALLSSL